MKNRKRVGKSKRKGQIKKVAKTPRADNMIDKEVQHARNKLENENKEKNKNIHVKASSLLKRLDLRMKSIVDSKICLLSLAVGSEIIKR